MVKTCLQRTHHVCPDPVCPLRSRLWRTRRPAQQKKSGGGCRRRRSCRTATGWTWRERSWYVTPHVTASIESFLRKQVMEQEQLQHDFLFEAALKPLTELRTTCFIFICRVHHSSASSQLKLKLSIRWVIFSDAAAETDSVVKIFLLSSVHFSWH